MPTTTTTPRLLFSYLLDFITAFGGAVRRWRAALLGTDVFSACFRFGTGGEPAAAAGAVAVGLNRQQQKATRAAPAAGP